jgi:hypothetical protein
MSRLFHDDSRHLVLAAALLPYIEKSNLLSGQKVEEDLVGCRCGVTAKPVQAWHNDCPTDEVQLRKDDEERYRPLQETIL